MKREIDKNIMILLSPSIVIIGMLLVYFVRGIYPFGSINISYYDMSQSMVPLYYHTYDVLHGTKSLFFDWYSGAGSSMADTVGNFVLSPFNLFFFFVKREKILESMSIFLIIKVSVAALSMSFYSLKKYKNIDEIWHVMIGILYASCGFIIQYYTNIHFLDIVALFPLLIWSYERLIQGRGVFCYTILFALFCVINIYLMGMICIYLILYGMVFLKHIEKNQRRNAIFRVGLYTCTAMMLSSVIVVPTIFSLTGSVRNVIAQTFDYLSNIKRLECYYGEQKKFMLYGSELTIAVVIAFLIQEKHNIKKISGNLLLFVLLVLPVWIEGINVLWHFGGYVQFPMRFGYMLSFTGLILTEEIIQFMQNENRESAGQEKLMQKIMGILSISILPLTIILLYAFSCSFLESGIRNLAPYRAYWICFLLLFLAYIFVLLSRRKKQIKLIIAFLVFCQMCIGWYGFLAPSDDYCPECGDQIVLGSEEIRGSGEFQTDYMDRIKDRSVSLSANYPFALQKAALSNWTWGVKEQLLNEMIRLGYSQNYTRLLDAGGTVFSDMLLNVKETITMEPPNAELYTTYSETENYCLNKMNFEYPFGILADEAFLEWDRNCETKGLEYQNELFRVLMDTDENLIEIYPEKSLSIHKGYDDQKHLYFYDYVLNVNEKIVLYLEMDKSWTDCMAVSVDGEFLKVPTLEEYDNEIYPAAFNNGFLECGVFSEGTVKLHIESVSEKETQDIKWGGLRLNILAESVKKIEGQKCTYNVGKSGITLHKVADKSGYAFLPIGYSDNWRVRVNGERIKPIAGMKGALLFVPIQKGQNEIELYFCPTGILLGSVLSLVGIAMFFYGRRGCPKMQDNHLLTYCTGILFYSLCGEIMVFVYFIPMIAYLFFRTINILI